MRRNTITSESKRPESKRAKVEQNPPPSSPSDQNTALVESLRGQNAAFTHSTSLALMNLFPINPQVTHIPTSVRHNTGFGLLQRTGQPMPIDQTKKNTLGSQDDLLRIFLIEQQLRSSPSGYTSNLPRTSLVHATGLIDPSSPHNFARLNCLESSRNLSATDAQHLMDRLLALPLQRNIERLNGSVLGTELSHLNGLRRLPLPTSPAAQLNERIQSHLLVTLNPDIRAPIARTPINSPKGFIGRSQEGDHLFILAMDSEHLVMSEYQSLLRQQIVFVESTASASNNNGKTQGRNKPIVSGQVGILCRHCASLPPEERPRGAIYYPAKLNRIYQAAQNMSHNHFASSCLRIPEETRQKLLSPKEKKSATVGAGKEYWYTAAMNVGIREGEDSLYFCKQTLN
ncbi:hypothetical protein FisN_35Lu036 [Fistulifera solaris]|uniref:Uncharacterized protein n=1 Tax=Fistulifera solaris TaxID=1519565 RepID=A0A1Z5KPS9_FISSO|nr:hypothetical protein FisN_35Lu036 [Fistulifera solaris]|eukprot:GAX28177.1 hypothetical protein FisN_35Lu036 [Fistulifera solaris]